MIQVFHKIDCIRHILYDQLSLEAMVNIPGSSKSCKECKARRVKGLSDRKLLNNAIQSPNNKLSTQSKNSAEGFYTNDRSNKNTTRHPITASLGCSMDLYRSVIADLWTATIGNWLANGEDGEGYRFHLDGALELIKHSGSEALESSVVRAAYVDLQTTALGQSLKFRKETFLVSGHWLALTRRLSTQDYRQSLLDIIAYIPGLLEQGEQMKLLASSLSKNTEYQDLPDYLSFPNVKKRQILDYFQDCDSLIHKLHLWLKSVENAEGGRLWWHSVTTLGDEYLQQRNLTSGRHHLPRIHFSNNRIPGIIVYYWSGLLELSATVLDIRQLFVHNTLYAALLDLLDADSPCLSMDLDTPNHCRSHLEDDIACSKDYETACMGSIQDSFFAYKDNFQFQGTHNRSQDLAWKNFWNCFWNGQ
ncbi:hypothetical protein TRIATDRAFT_90424 [Trichoderma atroviride IMI 206040]|uniref:Uncharacterized protein n=1 Tax=Hypocrea atroviridis (strain ATCC 20476 / IMI 206040) TaxID=452589 RepID=G9NGH7_HYPAI|nr:uncharacterized protein TRIATDRAFT_90424 [Trichoderma atroviride IMI 206040]EHK50388.1 hypothetical protein TRIATDRAFT_90424 [Trichoderma atroviride IMI 206040]